jgi:molecular chaperone HtpG
VQYVSAHEEAEATPLICAQIYDLARLAHKPLSPEDMTAFVQRSNEILLKMTKEDN